jgi:hypothetical protein
VLFSRQQVATEPDVVDALNAERRVVQARLLTITPGSDEVTTTLETWAARLRALRDQ